MITKRGFFSKPEDMAAITTISLVSLGILQVILGETLSRSIALTANGIDCIGDGFVSGIVWLGLRFFRRPADGRFHFGYYKVENLSSIAAAIVMFLLAGYILVRSYFQFIDPQEIQLPLLGAAVAFLSALVAWGLGVIKYVRGKRLRLGSVRLDAFNTIKDGTSSFLAVIALILDSYGFTIADAVVGFIIAGIIIVIGFTAIKESGLMLLDACDRSCVDQQQVVRSIILAIPGVVGIHGLRLRRSGPVVQGEVEIVVSGQMSVLALHQIQGGIQKRVRKRFSDIERLLVMA
ncbi:MAG: cation diffusion facilitator family transporter, partial [Methanobacteriota archaeon]